MSLSDYEIRKITEIVAGKVGGNLDAKELRKVIDTVVDNMQANRNNPEITGATCEVSSSQGQTGTSAAHESTPTSEMTDADDVIKNEAGLYQRIEQGKANRVIIAAFGKDRPGVVSSITKILAEMNCSIEDISQTLMQEFFSMIMVVNITESNVEFAALRDKLKDTESQLGMKVYVMHEDIFEYMHRI